MSQDITGAVRPQTKLPDGNYRLGRYLTDAALRAVSLLSGVSIISALAFSVIDAGHLSRSHSTLVAALSLCCAAGSIVLTRATRRAALVIVVALVAGEAFNVLQTAERIVTARAAVQDKARTTNDAREAAAERLAKSEAALTAFQSEARQTVAGKTCRSECRTLLEKQLDGLQTEVTAARRGVLEAPQEVEEAPLASRLGLSPWVLDLASAALLSLGSNLLGMTLIGWGARPLSESKYAADHYQETAQQGLDHDIQLAAEHIPQAQGARLIQAIEPEVDHDPKGGTPKALPVSDRTRGVLRLIQANGGSIEGPQRKLAQSLGIPQSSLNRALAEARLAGAVDIEAGKLKGTVVRLKRCG